MFLRGITSEQLRQIEFKQNVFVIIIGQDLYEKD